MALQDLIEFGEPGFGLRCTSQIVASTAAIVVKASPGILFAVQPANITTVSSYVKFYDATSATAGSGTPVLRVLIQPVATGNEAFTIPGGMAFQTGITMVSVAGFADNDSSSPTTSSYIVNVFYK